jgi:ataxia telangiectasia mutated family protein
MKHKVPALWFDMRLNYSRSVATTSIIGHVVGLGDRHVSNILMDEARGELVHIDLGIAFDQVRTSISSRVICAWDITESGRPCERDIDECTRTQGKRLPIPELVPFRLTQNLVDGFGMTGVEGVFRRCCEETLRVLRERSSVIMTILEVFKHDPLQSWSVRLSQPSRCRSLP